MYLNLNIRDLLGEIWKDIPDYKDCYKGSNLGRLKSLARINCYGKSVSEKILKQYKDVHGYLIVNLHNNGIRKAFKVHRLIALTFLENPNNYPKVLHKNDIKTYNRPENLRWGTQKQNIDDAIKTGIFNQKGEKHSQCKLSNKQIIEIRKLYKSDNFSQATLAKKFKTHQTNISGIITNKTWTHI